MYGIGAAVIGTGFIGPVHVEALRRMGARVVGVLGSSPAKSQTAAAEMGIPKAYANMAELVGDGEAQVVHITTPNRLHFEQASVALRAGKTRKPAPDSPSPITPFITSWLPLR